MAHANAAPAPRYVKQSGRKPVIAGRVPAPLYARIEAAARLSGRTLSEELAWRVERSFEKTTKSAKREQSLTQLKLRLDADLHAKLVAFARKNKTSLNGEIVNRLQESIQRREELISFLLAEHKTWSRDMVEAVYDELMR